MINTIYQTIYDDFILLKNDALYLAKLTKSYSSKNNIQSKEFNARIKTIARHILTGLAIVFFAYETIRLGPSFIRAPSLLKAFVPTVLKGASYLLSIFILHCAFEGD